MQVIACIRFIPISEADAESQHAVTHRHALKAPCHTEQYISFRQRRHVIEEQCSSLERLATFARVAELVSTPSKALSVLGLHEHPSVVAAQEAALSRSKLDAVRRKVVYHADPASLYSTAVADLNLRPRWPDPPAGEDGDRAAVEPAELEHFPEANHSKHLLFFTYASRCLLDTITKRFVDSDQGAYFRSRRLSEACCQ